MRALIIEDDAKLSALIGRGLQEERVVADIALTGEDALGMARATAYDAIVLDVMLPDIDGFEVCRRLRADGVWSPVLMLSARDAVEDRVRASTAAPTTTSSNRSCSPNSSRGCARSDAAARSSARRCCEAGDLSRRRRPRRSR